jgi:hypothetical protein
MSCWRETILVVAVPLLACGRTARVKAPSADASELVDTRTGADPSTDAGQETQTDTAVPKEAAVGPDRLAPEATLVHDATAERTEPDAASDAATADGAAETGGTDGVAERPARDAASDTSLTDTLPEIPCSALQALADKSLLSTSRSLEVHFSPDRTWLLLQVRVDVPSDAAVSGRLIRIDLPSGDITTIVDGIKRAEPLGLGGAFLLYGTGSDGNDTSVYDGKQVRTLLNGACYHKPTPDGRRVYFMRDCSYQGPGDLEVVEVATGGVMPVAKYVTNGEVVVTPNSRWAAFATRRPADGSYLSTISLVDAAGKLYTLDSSPGAANPELVSDDLLLFQVWGSSLSMSEIRGHVPGSGDQSYLIGVGDPGFGSYQISPDRTRLLVARMDTTSGAVLPGELYSLSLRGDDQRLLTQDLYNYAATSRALIPFGFGGLGKYAVYLSQGTTGALNSVRAVGLEGGAPRDLASSATFVPAPASSSAILYQTVSPSGQRLTLTDLSTGQDRLAYTSSGSLDRATPLANDDALLFAENVNKDWRLIFISEAQPMPLVLGEWKSSSLAMVRSTTTAPAGTYPVDPTGCFTIVDTDLAPGPGTRLVLLPK